MILTILLAINGFGFYDNPEDTFDQEIEFKEMELGDQEFIEEQLQIGAENIYASINNDEEL